VKEDPGLQLIHLQTRILTLRKEQYRLARIAGDEYSTTMARSKAEDGAHGLSAEILRTVRALKRLEEVRRIE